MLASRRHLLIVRTKDDDVVYPVDKRVRTASEGLAALKDQRYHRIEIAPEDDSADGGTNQQDVIRPILAKAYEQKGWTIFFDEGFELKRLGLTRLHERMLTQGRSKGISVITGVQRPSWVTRFTFSESSHALSFYHDGRDVKVLKDAYGVGHADAISRLDPDKHQFAWTSTRDRKTWIGNIQDLQGSRGRPAARADVGDAGDTGEAGESEASVRPHHGDDARRDRG